MNQGNVRKRWKKSLHLNLYTSLQNKIKMPVLHRTVVKKKLQSSRFAQQKKMSL